MTTTTRGKMDLSLLPSQAKFQMDKMLWKRRNRLAIGGMLGVWVLIITVVMAMNLAASWQSGQVEKSISNANKTLAGMAEGVVNSQRLKYNAKLVSRALVQRFEYGKAFRAIAKIFPEGIILDKIELKEKGLFLASGQMTGDKVLLFESTVNDINNGKDQKFMSFDLKTLGLINNIWQFTAEVKMK